MEKERGWETFDETDDCHATSSSSNLQPGYNMRGQLNICATPHGQREIPRGSENNFGASYVTDDTGCCYSLPDTPRAGWSLASTPSSSSCNKCSSSCENLSGVAKSQPPGDTAGLLTHAKLCKASSDNPIYAAAPPIPPRDYAPKMGAPLPRRAEIHAIMQDGVQLSGTHYWLLPDKPLRTPPGSESHGPELYMNVPHPPSASTSSQAATPSTSTSSSSRPFDAARGALGPAGFSTESSRAGTVGGTAGRGGGILSKSCTESTMHLLADEAEMDTVSVDLPYSDLVSKPVETSRHVAGAAVSHFTSSSAVGGGDYELERSVDHSTGSASTSLSMSDVKNMICQVQSIVKDVEYDESHTALQARGWNVEEAVKYLKVEHLFRLAMATRPMCLSLLEKYNWDLEQAGSAMVDISVSKSSGATGGGASTSPRDHQGRAIKTAAVVKDSADSAIKLRDPPLNKSGASSLSAVRPAPQASGAGVLSHGTAGLPHGSKAAATTSGATAPQALYSQGSGVPPQGSTGLPRASAGGVQPPSSGVAVQGLGSVEASKNQRNTGAELQSAKTVAGTEEHSKRHAHTGVYAASTTHEHGGTQLPPQQQQQQH